jgi:carbohydrate-selective porin OprB
MPADFECTRAADPRRRPRACNDHEFGLDEDLAKRWADLRREMQRIGFTPTASYVGALQTNAVGGSREVWPYAGLLSLGLSADLGKLIKVPGLMVYVSAAWGTGASFGEAINGPLPSSSLYAPSFYLGEMYLQEKLVHDKLSILAGRIAGGNGFANLPVFNNYVTYGINPNPYALGANDPTFFGPPPGSQWGAQATYVISPAVQIEGGIFNTNLNSANGANHGTDFALQEGNKGVLSIAEVDYFIHPNTRDKHKPGEVAVGVLHSNDSFPALNNPLVRSEGYSGVYVMAQQMVYRPRVSDAGATVWASWTYNSKQLVSPVPQLWSAGASYVGLLPTRPSDVISLGFVRSEGSRDGPPSNTASQLEINYQWFHSRHLTVTPHAQYLWKTQTRPAPNVLILGVQLALTL